MAPDSFSSFTASSLRLLLRIFFFSPFPPHLFLLLSLYSHFLYTLHSKPSNYPRISVLFPLSCTTKYFPFSFSLSLLLSSPLVYLFMVLLFCLCLPPLFYLFMPLLYRRLCCCSSLFVYAVVFFVYDTAFVRSLILLLFHCLCLCRCFITVYALLSFSLSLFVYAVVLFVYGIDAVPSVFFYCCCSISVSSLLFYLFMPLFYYLLWGGSLAVADVQYCCFLYFLYSFFICSSFFFRSVFLLYYFPLISPSAFYHSP